MVVRKLKIGQRRGAAAVETGLVLVMLTSVIFGVFEFSRLFLDWNLLNNAARQGCRYAIANNTNTAVTTNVQTIVTKYMAGQTASFSNFTVTVSGTHSGVSTPVNNLSAGDLLTVTVSGTYKFMNIIPVVKMSTNFTLTSSVIMKCEGGV